jgi:hypothetical protein
MTPHSAPQDEETFSDTSTIVPSLNHKAHNEDSPFLACDDPEDDDPEDESQFGCPCCMVPWFR